MEQKGWCRVVERLTDTAVVKDGKRYSPIIDGNKVREHAMDLYWRLKEYEDAAEQGLLLRLPCKVGDTIYSLEYGRIVEFTLYSFEITAKYVYCHSEKQLVGRMGVTVFATKEEAEQALAEMEK